MGSESMLQEILWDTKIGWWKVDMARRVLLLSDYLCKTIGTEESEIGYDRFLQSVGEPFRASLKSLMSTDASLFSAEQIFSLCGPRGEVWFRWKVLRRETAADKGLVVSGYAQGNQRKGGFAGRSLLDRADEYASLSVEQYFAYAAFFPSYWFHRRGDQQGSDRCPQDISWQPDLYRGVRLG